MLMRGRIALALLVAMLLLCAACTKEEEQTADLQPTPEAQVLLEEKAEETNAESAEFLLAAAKEYLLENYGKITIDGSTSMMPLHQSLQNMFGEQDWFSHHSRTVEAFEGFMAGENDILLGVDYSDELLANAKRLGLDIEKRAITREGFVFLININNPVKSLTIEQIKAIYSGEITNWRELGGDDAPIKAYQRNSDSGSQIRMEKFMDDRLLMPKDIKYELQGMGDVVEVISSYDEGKYSIAYNMYTFTEKQYTSEEIILLAVEDVQPNDETIFDETYPLVIYNYLYYDKNNVVACGFADNLYIYLMSEEGQALISDAGYVNLNQKYDRNREAEAPRENDYEVVTDLGWYDEEKGKFYDVDDRGNLLIFDNYADYELHDTEYINHARAREILEIIFAVNSRPEYFYVEAFFDNEEGTIVLSPWWDASLDPNDFFNYRFNGKYYDSLIYYINEDKYVLEAAQQDWLDSYANYFAEYPQEYLDNIDIDARLEIKAEELADLYFLFDFNRSDGGLWEFEYITVFE